MDDSNTDIALRIRRRTHQLLHQSAALCASHDIPPPDPIIRFDLRGQAAGQAEWRRHGRPLLRYNLDIARQHETEFLSTTVAHEVAHLITAACHGRTRPHGPEWRAVMTHLGIANPQRCHHYTLDEAAVKRQRRWDYLCDCSAHQLSTTRHKRVQSGASRYHCRRCDGLLRPATPCGD